MPRPAFDEHGNEFRCCGCGRNDIALSFASFRANAGFIVFRYKEDLAGYFCEFCIDDAFWKQHTLSALLGWWGVISFISNLFHMPLNVLTYIAAVREISPHNAIVAKGMWVAWVGALSAIVLGVTWWLGRFEDTPVRLGFAVFWWGVFALVPLGLTVAARALFRSKATNT